MLISIVIPISLKKVEEVDRIFCQEAVVKEAQTFLDEFKRNIQEDIANSRARTEERKKMLLQD